MIPETHNSLGNLILKFIIEKEALVYPYRAGFLMKAYLILFYS